MHFLGLISMKMKYFLLYFFLLLSLSVFAQSPVKWNFAATKISGNTYEVHLTADIQEGWHIYSQTTPSGGPLPTKIVFRKNPIALVSGTAKETGKLEQHYEEVFGVDVKFYSGKIDFVQVVKLKTAVKTTLTGTVEYMACMNDKCLPPAKQNFSIALN